MLSLWNLNDRVFIFNVLIVCGKLVQRKGLPNLRNRHKKKKLLNFDISQRVKREKEVIFNFSNGRPTKEKSDLLVPGFHFGFLTVNLNYEKKTISGTWMYLPQNNRVWHFFHRIRNMISAMAENAYRHFCHERGSNSRINAH